MSVAKSALGTLGRLAPVVFSFVIGFAISAGLGYFTFLAPVDSGSDEDLAFFIEKGATWRSVAQDLEEQGIVRSWMGIYLPLRIKNLSPMIEPGEYKLQKSFSPARIIQAINNREIVFRTVTFPEGTQNRDVPKLLAATTLVTEEEVLAAMMDAEIFAKYYIPVSSLEGYMFPDTYKFTRPITAKQIVDHIVARGVSLWTKERSEKAVNLGLSHHQVLTLASIIQREAALNSEMPIISSVYHNRLKTGMRLQADPTVEYGVPNFKGRLTKRDLETPSLYNTYLNTGLPPTPIANPGLAAIDAALNPAKTNFMYMVSKDGKSHHFSETYGEHQRAVDKYIRGKGSVVN